MLCCECGLVNLGKEASPAECSGVTQREDSRATTFTDSLPILKAVPSKVFLILYTRGLVLTSFTKRFIWGAESSLLSWRSHTPRIEASIPCWYYVQAGIMCRLGYCCCASGKNSPQFEVTPNYTATLPRFH